VSEEIKRLLAAMMCFKTEAIQAGRLTERERAALLTAVLDYGVRLYWRGAAAASRCLMAGHDADARPCQFCAEQDLTDQTDGREAALEERT